MEKANNLLIGHIASNQTILAELERHQKAHLKKLSTYKDLEQEYFQNPQELPKSAKFQYLTLLNGITYETDWLAWCDQVIQTIEKL